MINAKKKEKNHLYSIVLNLMICLKRREMEEDK